MKTSKDYGLEIKKGDIFIPGSRKALDKIALCTFLLSRGVEPKELEEITNNLKLEVIKEDDNRREREQEKILKKQEKQDSFDTVTFKLRRKEILSNSIYRQKIKTILLNENILAYMITDSGWVRLGLILDIIQKPADLYGIFSTKYAKELDALLNEIEEISTELGGPKTYNHEQITKWFFSDILPASEEYLEKDLKKLPHPLLLEGDEKKALKYVPFDRSVKPSLSPELTYFFERMHNHRYFCAYLFCSLLGYEIQQVLYLYGNGYDGKSTLFRMLQDNLQSFAVYTEGTQFSFHSMVDKAFIFLNENPQKYLLRNNLIKQLTGRDMVSIEAKGKKAYPDRIRGLFIVDSNKEPYIYGQKSETRRLRPFHVKTMVNVKEQSIEDAAKAYTGDFNGFLAYCQECYNELKTETGLVKDPPDLQEQLASLRDPDQEVHFSKMMEKLRTRNIVINSEASIKAIVLHTAINAIQERDKIGSKDPYFTANFIAYLEGSFKCKKIKDTYFGIGEEEILVESTGKTRFVKKVT